MPSYETPEQRLARIRQYRTHPEPDLSLAFLSDTFKREVEKPFRQLGDLGALWNQFVPEHLLEHTRLESFSRGVLRVVVRSSAHLYELDRLLREGLKTQLIEHHRGGTLRKIMLRTGNID